MFASLLTSYTTRHSKISSSLALISIFASLLTSYTTKHNKISSSLADQCSQVYLPATPPNITTLASAFHINIRKSTYFLHHQPQQNQQPFISIFVSLLTSYTTRHSKISSSLAYQCSQVYLLPTPPETA